jgi:hypothetical protein
MARLRMTRLNSRERRGPGPIGAKPAAARRPLPVSVLIRPALFRTIARAGGEAGECETGGPLIGTVQRSWEGPRGKLLVSVLATVPPGPRVRASSASVALGCTADGERAASALRWWRAVTGLDLLHVGDWHKHPSGAPQPSLGDCRTAERMHAESRCPIWLTAIAVGGRLAKADAVADGNLVRFGRSCDESGQVSFYRQTDATGLAPVPIRLERDATPCLPALPWHITDPGRFAAEFRLLHGAGFSLGVDASRPGRHPGLALRIARDGTPPLTVHTGPRYPHDPPVVLDERNRRVALDGGWSPDRFLLDLVGKAA